MCVVFPSRALWQVLAWLALKLGSLRKALWQVLAWLAIKLGSLILRGKARAAAPAAAAVAIDQQQNGAGRIHTVNSLSFDQWQDEQPVFGPGRNAAAMAAGGGDSRRSTDAYGAEEFLGFASGDQAGLRLRQAKPGLAPSAVAAGPSYARSKPAAAARFAAPESPTAAEGRWNIFRSPTPPLPPEDWLYRENRVHPAPPEEAHPAIPSSPWSSEKPVYSVSKSKAKPAPVAVAVPAASPRPAASGPSRATRRSPEPAEESPLVKQGKIWSMETNRAIKINGPKYNQLVAAGWVPDRKHGTLLPPKSVLHDDE